jgi:hypothetical protein
MDIPKYMTAEYLRRHPNVVFVFGDNLLRKGKGGAATLRDEPNTYGFITKKAPNNKDESFYRPEEYVHVFWQEMVHLIVEVSNHPEKTYAVSPLGSGLANRYKIYETIIKPMLKILDNQNKNVVLL